MQRIVNWSVDQLTYIPNHEKNYVMQCHEWIYLWDRIQWPPVGSRLLSYRILGKSWFYQSQCKVEVQYCSTELSYKWRVYAEKKFQSLIQNVVLNEVKILLGIKISQFQTANYLFRKAFDVICMNVGTKAFKWFYQISCYLGSGCIHLAICLFVCKFIYWPLCL